jgi:DNA-directed RNA polymerase specialized sigma24 family protein
MSESPNPSAAGCNAMARPALRRVGGRPEEVGARRVVHLDRDRPLVEAAQADPARFEALYRKYVAQVYSYAAYELRDRHDAEDATERTFLAALAHLGRFEERARPEDGDGASTFRVWLFQIARNVVAERGRSDGGVGRPSIWKASHTSVEPSANQTEILAIQEIAPEAATNIH